MILSIVSAITSTLGIIGIWQGITYLIIIGAIVDIIENLIGVYSGEQNSLFTMFLAIVIGFIVGSRKNTIFISICSALCIESFIMFVFSIPIYILMFKNIKK